MTPPNVLLNASGAPTISHVMLHRRGRYKIGHMLVVWLMAALFLATSGCVRSQSNDDQQAPSSSAVDVVDAHHAADASNAKTVIQSDALSDWRQIRGNRGNGIAEGLAVAPWNSAGLKQRWSVAIGTGLSSPIVFGKHVFLVHRRSSDKDALTADLISVDSGERIWRQSIACQYQGSMDGDRGPKSTPVFAAGKIYVLGPRGNLTCLEAATGKTIWQKDTLNIYKTNEGYFGVGSSPTVVDNKIIVNVGGRNAAVVAFDTQTGNELWKAFDDRASYSSPISVDLGGPQAVIIVTRLHVLGIDAADGAVVFSQRFGVSGPTAIGAMPVLSGTKVLVNGAYNVGARCLELDVAGKTFGQRGYAPATTWEDAHVFASQYSTAVLKDGYFYGTSGREDMHNGSFRCFEAATGRLVWQQKGVPIGHCILVRDRILFLDHQGQLSLLAASPNGYQSLASFRISDSGTRTIPAVAKGCLFTRTNGVRATLDCWQLPQAVKTP